MDLFAFRGDLENRDNSLLLSLNTFSRVGAENIDLLDVLRTLDSKVYKTLEGKISMVTFL